MFSIGALALKATGKRTGAPVHRYSKPLGKCEAGFWRRVDKREVWKIVDAAEAYDLANKAPGARKGPAWQHRNQGAEGTGPLCRLPHGPS